MKPQITIKTDEELLYAIATGCEESFAELYDRYKTVLFNIIFRLINNRVEAEDVLQDAFFQIWQKASYFDKTRGRGFTWIVTISRRRAIDKIRSISSQNRIGIESHFPKTDRFFNAEEELFQTQRKNVIQKAITHLPEEQRKLVKLSYFENLSQSEIADRLKIPLGTIKTRTGSAFNRLRANFSLQAFL
jgi:RNA polymerase sigma-70 factor, ECF subfamily